MPIVALLGFALMGLFGTVAYEEKMTLLAQPPKTWKGDMLCPPGQDDCNTPTPTPTVRDRIIK